MNLQNYLEVSLSWEIIDTHRKKARSTKLDILVWGPGDSDSELSSIRENVKMMLSNNGHSAKFSEELINFGKTQAAPDPLIDEIFHADAANTIIVIYRSRGTQTEFDRILKYDRLLRKSVIFIEKDTYNEIMKSISSEIWKNINCKVYIVDSFNEKHISEEIEKHVERLQFLEYMRKLEVEFLN